MRRTTVHTTFALLAGIAAAACDSLTGPETEVINAYRANGIALTASVRILTEGRLEVTLTATNETDFRAQLGILGGNCMFRPRVYANRDGRLLWSAFDLFDACQEPIRLFDLEGGASESESRTLDADVSGGDRFVTLTIEHLELVELAAGTVAFR
jgi:hypothetical protein